MPLQNLTDDQLVNLLKESDKSAFDEVYARYWKLLFSLAYHQLGAKEEAEDMVHNVFERVWKNRLALNISCLKAYLVVSIRNFSVNHIKSQLTYRKYQEYIIFQEIQRNFSTEDIVNYTDLQRVINEVLKKLPEKTLEIFKMSRYDNQSTKDIAIKLHLTEKAVEYHITKSLKFIKEHLDNYYHPN